MTAEAVNGQSWLGRQSRLARQSTAKLAGEGDNRRESWREREAVDGKAGWRGRSRDAKLAREAVDGETGDDCGVDGGDCAVKNTTSVEERVGVDNGDRGGDGVDGKIWQEREAVDGRAGRGGRQSMSNLAGEAAVQPVVMALTTKQTGDAVDRSIGGEGIDEQS